MKDINTEVLKRDLLDDDGENLAVRAFLQMYGSTPTCPVISMRAHLARSGFDGCWPAWAAAPNSQAMTKGGAQSWLRYLFALEAALSPPAVTDISGQEGEREAFEVEERESDEYTINRMATILAEIAVALKGEELPRQRHSYHDLGELVRIKVLECDLSKAHIEQLQTKIAALSQPPAAQVPEDFAVVSKADLLKIKHAMESCDAGDYSTGCVIHPSHNEKAIDEALNAISLMIAASPSPAAVRVEEVPAGISVDERLPDYGVEVLLYRPDAAKSYDPIYTVRKRRKGYHGPFEFECVAVPTLWWPLPPSPAAKKEGNE